MLLSEQQRAALCLSLTRGAVDFRQEGERLSRLGDTKRASNMVAFSTTCRALFARVEKDYSLSDLNELELQVLLAAIRYSAMVFEQLAHENRGKIEWANFCAASVQFGAFSDWLERELKPTPILPATR